MHPSPLPVAQQEGKTESRLGREQEFLIVPYYLASGIRDPIFSGSISRYKV